MNTAWTRDRKERRWLHPLRALGAAGSLCGLALASNCARSEHGDEQVSPEPPSRSSAPERGAAPELSAAAPPRGFEPIEVAGVAGTSHGHAVVLTTREWALPILVGPTEGVSIELRLLGSRFHRPLTHDLIDAMLREFGAHVESVRVERAEQAVFHSVIVLRRDGKRSELDARTSDAIALALGSHVPIFVRSELLRRDGVRLDELHEHREAPSTPDGLPSEARTTTTL